MGAVEIPLTPRAQRLSVTLGGIVYRMRVTYNTAGLGGWILDIGNADGILLVAGIPLVTGVDLLAQYAYLDFNGQLYITTDRGAGDAPTYGGLGLTSHLYFVPN